MIDAHRGAFEYDWRTRFNQDRGLAIIGTRRMSWGEALRQTSILAVDSSSQIAASLAGWDHPVSRETLVLMDLFDLQHITMSKRKPKPYPRPWPESGKRRTAPDAEVTQDDILAALRRAGHDAPLPTPKH